jgi:molybdopterin-guanine dinucleotide biosynthesis protein B
VHRSANGKSLLFPNDPAIVGIASDVDVETELPTVHLDDIAAAAALLLRSAMPIAEMQVRS